MWRGRPLSDLLKRRGTLTEAELKHILLPLLAGLIDVHEAGILHRDIKPGNILLRAADGSPVLVDFGAARQAVGARSRSVTAVLTPGYAPIEQYSSRGHQGPWTDMYALGGLCYQALTGKVPDEAMDRIRSDPLIPVTEAAKGKATEAFLSAIDWALRVEEADRPQGIRVWRSALLGEEEVPVPVSASTPTQQKPPPDKTPKITQWLTALGVLLLIGVGAWWSIQEYPELYGQGTGESQGVTEQGAPAEAPSETPQETQIGETGEAVAGVEETPSADKTEIEQPALSAEEAEVARLLVAAETDLKARRLTSPAGNNAWDNYQRALELVPAHPDAVKGMERVIESYMELFETAVGQEDFDKADGYLTKIRDLHPDSPVLEAGEQRLEAAKQARAGRLAEIERQRKAEEAERQATLERQRIAQAVEARWVAFDTALETENLSEAANILNQVRDLNPEAPGLAAGEQRLSELERQLLKQGIETHWAAFEEAIQAEDLDEAAGILTQVRDLNPEAQGLAEGEQHLTKARQTALEREYAGEMISIPGGTFRMGDLSGDGDDDERPVHSVTVPVFSMGKYEVTFAQWDTCVAYGGCGVYRPDDEGWDRGNRPVINVSWDDAQSFIDWLNNKTGGIFRLPTEAEWEYAARAGNTTKYSWGDSIGHNRANCEGCGSRWDDDRTAPVGSFSANAWGLHEIHGNVREWVRDCWNDSYVGAPSDGRAWTSGDCSQRLFRSGSWYDLSEWVRSSSRAKNSRSSQFSNLGFRLARDG